MLMDTWMGRLREGERGLDRDRGKRERETERASERTSARKIWK